MKVNVTLTPMYLSDALTEKLVTDDTMIVIKDMSGQRLAFGHWFNDDVLNIVTDRKYIVRYWYGETRKNGEQFFLLVVDR